MDFKRCFTFSVFNLFAFSFMLLILCRSHTVIALNLKLFLEAYSSGKCIPEPDPEVCMNASQLITSKGYPCQEYTVQTEDGFLIDIQRIPHGKIAAASPVDLNLHGNKQATNQTQRPVVFLQHGLLCASTNWLTNLRNESFAYLLADAGFDVWLGNVRGNTYGRRHIKYRPSDDAFWAWSWDEMGEYDLEAMIEFALKKTNQKQLYYIGHSQGTLIMFAHLARKPQFADKVKAFFALGPVITTGNIRSPVKLLAYISEDIQELFYFLGVKEFLPHSWLIKLMGETVCRLAPTELICEDVIFIICGFDNKQLNSSRLPVYLSHTPAGTSVQNLVHFAQMVRSDLFQMYDYGSDSNNIDHYGQRSPPIYNPAHVKAPVYLYSAQDDWLADPKDVRKLAAQLPNLKLHRQIANWDHLDFVWGMDARYVLYDEIIGIIKTLS